MLADIIQTEKKKRKNTEKQTLNDLWDMSSSLVSLYSES